MTPAIAGQPEHRAFISYSSRDVDLARALHALLSEEVGWDVWRDERAIERDWSREIADGLVGSDAVTLLWTSSAAASNWVRHEWLTARALQKSIVPILAPGAPDLPAPLQNLHGVAVRNGTIDPAALRARLAAQLAAPAAYDFTIRPADLFVPLRPNPHFVGRGADLVALYLRLIGNLNKLGVSSVGVVGMGGVGKTQLAVEFVHRFSFAFDGVHWLTATDESDWIARFIALARDELRLGEDSPSPPANDREWLQALRRHCVDHPKMLVVMDNVSEPERLNDPATLLGVAPLDLGCNLLFTTRRQFDLPDADVHYVGVLSADESFALLTARRAPDGDEEIASARAICAALGHLPLALALASAYLGRYTSVPFETYRRNLAERRLDTIDVQNLSSASLATRHVAAVRATLESQWNVLDNPDARHLLTLAALMGEGEVVPKARLGLLAGIAQDADALVRPLDDASLLLEELTLAERAEDARALRMHPLIREFVLELVADAAAERSAAAQRLAGAYASAERVEREYAERGLASVIEDSALGARWIDAGPVRDALLSLRRALDAESTTLYRFPHGAHPAFFLQQLANRADATGLSSFASGARRCLAARRAPHFVQLWRTRRSSPELVRTLAEHSGWVNDVRLTADGRVVTASEKGTIAVWDLETGRLIEQLRGHDGAVERVAVLDQNRALSAGADGTLRLWDLATGAELRSVAAHEGELELVVAYAGGRRALTGGRDRRLRAWDTETLAPLQEIRVGDWPSALALMPGERQALVARFSPPPGSGKGLMYNRGLLDLVDLETGECLWTREVHEFVVDAILVRPDGGRVLTAGRDDVVRVWDPRTWADPVEIRGQNPAALAFLPDGNHAVVGAGRDVRLVDIETGRMVRRLKGHSGVLRAVDVAPDGRTLVTAGSDDTVRIWDVASAAAPSPAHADTHAQAVSTVLALDEAAVTGDMDGELRLWHMETGDLLGSWKHWTGMRGNARAAHRGRIVLTSSADLEGGSILALDLAERSEHTVWSTSGRVSFLALDADEKLLFVAGGGGAQVDLIEAADLGDLRGRGYFLRELKAPEGRNWLNGAALTPDGRLLVAAASEAFGSSDELFLFDVASGRIIARCDGAKGNVQQLAITPEGDMVTFATTGGTLALWRPGAGDEASVIARGLGQDPKLALLPGRRLLVTAAEEVCVWDVGSGERRARLSGHPGVWHLVVTGPREILTASEDWTVTLWDVEAGAEIATLALDGEAREIAVAPDGVTVVAGDGGGDVYAFRLLRGTAAP